jgi:acetyltransferase-like isoleucine patch superfamily enzyme
MKMTLIYASFNAVAKKLRGSSYNIDPNIPLRSILEIAITRLIQLTRSTIKYGFSPRKRIFIGADVVIKNKKFLNLADRVIIGRGSYINALSRQGVKIGQGVSIGDSCRIEASGTITNLGLGIEIGSNTGIGSYCFIGGAGGVKIGQDVIMGQWVSFHPENHNFDDIKMPIRLQGINRQGITVGDNCWIGVKATFLDGSNVGEGSIIAAGSVVRGVIPPYSIAGGVPARVIRSRLTRESKS